jgi:hypothetical protein
VALAAVAGFFFSGSAAAQGTVILSGASGNSCSYTSMSVQPNGSVSVNCNAGTTPPVDPLLPGSFSLSGPSALSVNAVGTFSVIRSGGTAGDANLGWAASGGCLPAGGVVTFPNGNTNAQTITVTAPAAAGQCVIAIGGPSVGTLGTPPMLNVAIQSGPLPGDPGCTATPPPPDVLDFDLKLSGADVQRMSSGRIASAVLPVVGRASGQVVLGETTTSPRSAVVEISINKCRGVIDTTVAACYLRTDNPTFATLTWLETPKWGASTDGIAAAYGLCKAYTDQKWYVNMRYTYQTCNYGTCGFVSQWNYGPY